MKRITITEYMRWCSENCDLCANRSKCALEDTLFRAMTSLEKTDVKFSGPQWTTSGCPKKVPAKKKIYNMKVFGKSEPYKKW